MRVLKRKGFALDENLLSIRGLVLDKSIGCNN
jgi:hypothetical protein